MRLRGSAVTLRVGNKESRGAWLASANKSRLRPNPERSSIVAKNCFMMLATPCSGMSYLPADDQLDAAVMDACSVLRCLTRSNECCVA